MQRKSTRLWLALQLALGTACASTAWSQTVVFTPGSAAPASGNFMIKLGAARCGAWESMALHGTAESGNKLGAPYSGVGVTEVVNTLVDGNRITRKNTMRYFRDSFGRTRTEFELGALGPVTPDVKRTAVTINDPPAKAHYILHPEDKLAMEFNIDGASGAFAGVGAPGVMVASEERNLVSGSSTGSGSGGRAVRNHMVLMRKQSAGPFDKAGCAGQPKPTPVSLGERTIDGLKTTGSRLEIVIPAGEVGNELPITTTTEQWFSPELGVVISSTHQDPMSGNTTYRLTQISRAEPDAKLFTVPADYKRQPVEAQKFEMKLQKPGTATDRPAEQ
jgi:hypothetical protein